MARAVKAPAGAIEPAEAVSDSVLPPLPVGEGWGEGATHLRIKSKREGFRRAGHAWSMTEQTVSAADFTADQADALQNEPMLIVTPIIEAE